MRNGMPRTNLENEGLVLAGWMFDDGCHALATGEPVAISSGSDKKEGAWEFLCFLLGDEVPDRSGGLFLRCFSQEKCLYRICK